MPTDHSATLRARAAGLNECLFLWNSGDVSSGESVEDFAGVVDDQCPFILFAFVIGYVYLPGIHIAEVYFFAPAFGDAGCKRYVDPRLFNAVDKCPDSLDVGRMCGYAAREVFEPVPLLEEIIPCMVANLVDDLAVRVRNLGDMRCVDNQCSAVGHYRF